METFFLFTYSFGYKHHDTVKMPDYYLRMPKLDVKHRPTDDIEYDTALSTPSLFLILQIRSIPSQL